MIDTSQILGAQPVTDDIAFMQTMKFLPDVVDYLLMIRFGNFSSNGHFLNFIRLKGFPVQYATTYCLTYKIAVGKRRFFRTFKLGAKRFVILSGCPVGVAIGFAM